VLALKEPVPEDAVDAVATWLGDALAPMTHVKSWWRLVWHCSDDKLVLTFAAWRTKHAGTCVYLPERVAAAMRALPFPAKLATPTLVVVSLVPKADFEALKAKSFASDDMSTQLTRFIGRVQRRVNVDRCQLFSAGADVPSSA
jgi:hypothetical protein